MDLSSKGIRYGAEQGHLALMPELTQSLVIQDPISDYFDVEQKAFARGKFAAVRRARCLRTGEFYAAKVVRKRRRATDVRHESLHETAVLALSADHPKIVKLHRVFESASEMILVLEMASGGELHRVIDEEESIEECVTKKYLRDVLSALRFLHSYDIAHLDLKPQNLLLTGSHPDSDLKLCDFGISRHLNSNMEVREVMGTLDYVAPEILQYEPISLATDMWSVGVLTYVLLTGHSPFGGDTKQQTSLNISQGEVDFPEDLFENISSQAITFISQLLIVDPRSRLTVDEALNHPWLSDTKSVVIDIPTPDHLTTQPTKRPNSPTNKENNRNFLNNFTEQDDLPSVVHDTFAHTSPPSKRECRDSPRLLRSGIEYQYLNFDSPKVSDQIRHFERIQSHSQEDMSSNVDLISGKRIDHKNIPKIHNKDDTRFERRHSLRKGNLNRSFGSVDYREKDKMRSSLRLSPLCLRRDRKKCDGKDPKFGSRRELQDIVRENSLIC